MAKKFLCSCAVFSVLMLSGGNLFASSGEHLEKELESLKERLNILEKKTEEAKEFKGVLSDLVIGGGITLVLQNAQNANADSTDLYNGKTPSVASYSVDLGFEKNFDENNKMFIHLETGQGSIESQLKVFSNVNRDSDESDGAISVTEAWYEHAFSESGFKLNIGKIDATSGVDENAYANDETEQFLGNIFRNSSVVDFPDDNSFGVKVAYESDKADVSLQYLSADGLWKDVTKNIFVSGQLNLKPEFIKEKEGNYRFYGWTNTKQYVKWTDSSKNNENNYGFGVSFDQQLTDKTGAFARYGWKNQEVYCAGSDFSLSQSWSLGLQFAAKLISSEDILAVAYGQVIPSSDYKDVNGFNAKTENHVEVYYKLQITDYLSVTPDIQVIENPYGGDAGNNDTIFVGGIRMQISF